MDWLSLLMEKQLAMCASVRCCTVMYVAINLNSIITMIEGICLLFVIAL